MRRLCLVLIPLLAVGLLATAVAAGWRTEPQLRGTDEIYYLDLRGLDLQPGESWGQDLAIQHPGLSLISFPYRVDPSGPGRIRLRVETPAGLTIADRLLDLAPTPSIDARSVWFQATFWGPVAKYEEVPVTGAGAATKLKLTFYVPPGSPPVALFWDAVDPLSGDATRYPEGVGPDSLPSRRVAVSTGYGPLTPAPLRFWTYESRVAAVAPPWIPQPAPALLLVAALLLAGRLVWSVAGARPYSPWSGVEAEGSGAGVAERQSPPS